MKKIFTLLCAAMMVAGVEAELIFHESFDREIGTLCKGKNTDMGSNTTDWWSYSGGTGSTPKFIQVAEGTLSYTGYVTTGIGNKAYIWSSDADDFRKLDKAYTSGKIYFAAIVNVAELRQGTTPDYFLCFGDGGAQNMYARLYSRSVQDEGGNFIGYRLGIAKFTETNTTAVRHTSEVLEPNKDYLVVVEYEFVDGEKNDKVNLYVNPTKTTVDPTLECLQDSLNEGGTQIGAISKADASKIASVNLRQGSNTPRQVYVDEIKVATSWSDLFEEDGGQQEDDPVINAASSVEFGNVTVNEAAEKKLTVRGSNLKGAVSVVSSSEALVPAVSSIGKVAAEAGYELTLTLTASEVGEGSANITLSAEGAESKVVSVSWNAVAPPAEAEDIAALKELAPWGDPVLLKTQPIVIRVTEEGAAVQDESGAIFVVDGDGAYMSLKAGDKLQLGTIQRIEDEYGVEGYPSIYAGSISVISSDNTLVPFDVTIAELEQYGPAFVKVSGVSFPEEAETFAAGNIAISQSGASVNMYILAGNDIIGEAVPVSADVQGCVRMFYGLKLQISSSADVSNRVPKGGDTPVYDNLLQNPSFEEHSCSAMGCQFDAWSMPLGSGSANSTDKLDGEVALYMNPTAISAALDQGVLLDDATYATGTQFELTINYKVLSMPEGSSLTLDCYWEAAAGGDEAATKSHDADILQVPLENGSGWVQKKVVTSKPVKSSYFRVRVATPKSAKVLFDDWSLYEQGVAPGEPFITVTPVQVSSVQTTLGNTVNFQTIHIKHGNVTSATTFYIGGKDAGQFQQSASALPADQSELDLIITYAPTSAGTHEASLIFDNVNHTTILPNLISLRGSCTDPSAKPEITVTPSVLEDFEVLAGNRQEKTLTVSSVNCTDFVYARVDHIQGAAFTIDGTMAGKNYDATVTVAFAPQTAGTFQSTVTFYTAGGDDVVVNLNGVGLAPTPETVDWQTDFSWDESHPLAYMFEPFDNAEHNKTLLVDGWQNVANAEQRPWWGFDESLTTPVRGEEKYAKATAYKWGAGSTGDWSMWLVTPALDYKNAETKVFAFKVMGEYLSDEQEAALEIYYVDPAQPTDDLRFQDLTAAFSIPKTGDESGQWVSFNLDLEPFAATVADVFHMAFKYVGPNGDAGAVTYYIDDVSWGKEQPMGIESIQSSDVSSQKILRNGQLIILRGDLQFNVLGIRVK